ncbi:MAG TPA: DMT family transporter [Flavitalea sp.]|nr:DMT family transporter [Flavitalea sp.]
MEATAGRKIFIGISLAVFATFIWSGNFIVARAVYQQIPPVSLAFFRWLTATIMLLPFSINLLKSDYPVIRFNFAYLFWTALSGITLFNTFVYIAGHYTEAINLALIGTTSSPVFALILAAVFLKERIGLLRVTGMLTCISGIFYLLSRGSISRLLALRFSEGDLWILTAALCFAIYNTLVKKKPAGLRPVSYLCITFLIGTILLFPAYVTEAQYTTIQWSMELIGIILYLGLGTSVISFLCWNAAIARLGSARTALFGNLIPLFSTFEAVLILNEKITWVHLVSGILIICGLVLANLQTKI